MVKNLMFIFGQDRFFSQSFLQKLKSRYLSRSLGSTNLVILEGEKIKRLEEVLSAIQTPPFLAGKRLIIIHRLIQANSQLANQLIDYLEQLPKTNLVVFFESGNPNPKIKLVAYLTKKALVKKFQPLKGFQLRNWVRRELAKYDKTIQPAALELLIKFKLGASGALYQEILKLGMLDRKEIDSEIIRHLVKPTFDERIYQLTDKLLSAASLREKYRQLDKLRLSGESEGKIFFSLIIFWRFLLFASQAETRNWRVYQSEYGMNYYLAVRLARTQLPSFNRLARFYRQLLDYDIQIKTGKIEIGVALDLIIYQSNLILNACY